MSVFDINNDNEMLESKLKPRIEHKAKQVSINNGTVTLSDFDKVCKLSTLDLDNIKDVVPYPLIEASDIALYTSTVSAENNYKGISGFRGDRFVLAAPEWNFNQFSVDNLNVDCKEFSVESLMKNDKKLCSINLNHCQVHSKVYKHRPLVSIGLKDSRFKAETLCICEKNDHVTEQFDRLYFRSDKYTWKKALRYLGFEWIEGLKEIYAFVGDFQWYKIVKGEGELNIDVLKLDEMPSNYIEGKRVAHTFDLTQWNWCSTN